MSAPLVDIVVVDYGTPELAARAEETIRERFGVPFTLQVVDAKAAGLSYAQAINCGVATRGAPYVLALNADVECLQSQAPVVVLFEMNPAIAVVGPRQVDAHGLIRHAGIVGRNDAPIHRHWGEPCEQTTPNGYPVAVAREAALECVTVAGSVYYARRSAWRQLGGFLETPHYYEETWFSYLARHRGWRVVYTGAVTWLHHWARSPVSDEWRVARFREARELFRAACAKEGIVCE